MRRMMFTVLALGGCVFAPTGSTPADSASSASTPMDALDAARAVDSATPLDGATPIDAATPLDAAVCADDITLPGVAGCQFYACREAESPCGASGYYLGFGEKYCERFLTDVAPQMSSAGQAFLAAARDCLMHYVDDHIAVDLSCDEVRTDALASHVACYRDNGFCAIPLTDKAALFLAIDPADRDYFSIIETQLACL